MTGPSIEICLSPGLLHTCPVEGKTVVVIDVLRATSSMVYGLQNGARAIIPVSTLEECRAYAGKGYLLAAERDGSKVEGFELGNSPFHYVPEIVGGKTVVMTTTNGTRALKMASAAGKIYAGAFLNLTVLAQRLKEEQKDVVLLASGWKDKVNLEDTVLAGALFHLIRKDFESHCDACILAEHMYWEHRNTLHRLMEHSSHSHRLKQLGIQKDVDFCLRPDTCTVIPVYRRGELVAS